MVVACWQAVEGGGFAVNLVWVFMCLHCFIDGALPETRVPWTTSRLCRIHFPPNGSLHTWEGENKQTNMSEDVRNRNFRAVLLVVFPVSALEHQKENVRLHRSLLGWCEMDFAQLYHIQWRWVGCSDEWWLMESTLFNRNCFFSQAITNSQRLLKW